MIPTPSNVSAGTLDMSLRELLAHMMDKKLDHVVLVVPALPVRISVTVASERKTEEITKQVQKIIGRLATSGVVKPT